MNQIPTRPSDGLQHWTVGHDGSTGAAHAVEWALAQAAGRRVHVRLVRGWEVPALDFPLPVTAIEELAPPAISGDIAEIERAATDIGVELTTVIERGAAARILLDASEDGDLLIVGSRGMGGFRRLLLGSVSAQCATHAVVPTVVVPAAAATDRPVGHVLVGVDGSDRSRAALRWATDFLGDDAEITVMEAWRPSRSGFVAAAQEYAHEDRTAAERFDEIVDEHERATGRRLARTFVHGDPARELLRSAGEACDLLVLGQRGHSGLAGALLGSVATQVLHHSPVPVAVVPDADDH